MTAPQFRLNAENQAHADICRAVHGMPLGILLSTSWLGILEPHEICAEIDQNFDFLETTLYGLPERQRSMRAVFNHTWKLLSDWEQRILQGLSAFRGGFSRQAASFVTGAALSDLKTMSSKWLIERDRQGRFILHELLRQYLEERLDEDTVTKVKVKDKHLMYFANFLQERSGELEGNEPRQAIAGIGLEIENIRAAWSWALSQRNLETIDRSLEGLAKFYELSASYQEGENAFTQAGEMLMLIQDTDDWNNKNRLLLGKFGAARIILGMQGLVSKTIEVLSKG
jgi:predicted ATPase